MAKPRRVDGIDGLREVLGTEIGPSEWRTVGMPEIEAFSRISGAASPAAGGDVTADGNLILALTDGFRRELIVTTGFEMGINYGWEEVRMPAPLPCGGRVRARSRIITLEPVGAAGWWQTVTRFTVELEGADQPCLVGDSVSRLLPAAPQTPS